MKNLDTPAYATRTQAGDAAKSEGGLTKRDRACIDLCVPNSGDEELDAIIDEARRRNATLALAVAEKARVATTVSGAIGNAVDGIEERGQYL